MNEFAPLPIPEEMYWFFANDQVKKETEYQAKVVKAYSFQDSANKFICKYDDFVQDVIKIPLMDIWLEEAADLFWILAENTDYIIELSIPDLCVHPVFIARTVDGGWHSFETHVPNQFGFLDVTGEYHNKLHSGN